MGAAAEHRGNALIRRNLESQMRPVEFEIMDSLNSMRKYEDAGTPPCGLVFVEGNGGWWALCSGYEDGFGYWYKSIREAVRRWNVVVTGYNSGKWYADRIVCGS